MRDCQFHLVLRSGGRPISAVQIPRGPAGDRSLTDGWTSFVSTVMVGRRQRSRPGRAVRKRRAALARAALAHIRGDAPGELPTAARGSLPTVLRVVAALRAAPAARLCAHACVVALILTVLGAEVSGRGGAASVARSAPVTERATPLATHDGVVLAPLAVGPIRIRQAAEPLTPLIQQPVTVPSAFQTVHQLAEGETLGALAARYGVRLEALVLANRLEQGDALVVGQLLRIPRVSGQPHVVATGETLASLAERFGVSPAVIATFPANHVGPDAALTPGVELFIPREQLSLPADWLRAVGGLTGLAARGPEPAAVVRAAETNLRVGPSTEHPRVAQLAAGRRVALRARHDGWLQVELGTLRGWVRADLLAVAAEQVAALPLSNDFPPPPPRWVWPTRGTLTSGFGPRWGSFHNGIDIANRAWTPIVAARAGRVREAGWCRGYGYCVRLGHAGGVETIYGHLIARPLVSVGDEVAVGELIGHMGSTYDRAGGGYSTGVHLHFTVLVNGRAVNPLRFLP